MTEKLNPLEITYFQIVDIWHSFCEKHSTLLEQTITEYTHLLDNEIEKLDECVKKKEETIADISILEEMRLEIMEELNSHLGQDEKIKDVSSLISLMQLFEKENDHNFLHKYNELLIDIIEKIKEQNKINQLFIQKSMSSLKKIKEDITGNKSYDAYNPKGESTEGKVI